MISASIKTRFPNLCQHPDVVYLDSAATTQKPDQVIAAVNEYHSTATANSGRGNYGWANQVTQKIGEVREKVARFLHAHAADEVVFTAGATDSLHTVLYAWAFHHLADGDEILYSPLDHASNVLPWIHLQGLLARAQIQIKLISYPLEAAGCADIAGLAALITPKTKLITLTHIHNVFGAKTLIETLQTPYRDQIAIVLDASQSIGHIPVDVQNLGVDFVAFSGHKLFASTGVGVLWVHKRRFAQLHPYRLGGGTGDFVDLSWLHLKPDAPPAHLEAGTLNLAGILSLGAALDFIGEIGLSNITDHVLNLTRYLIDQLKQLPHIDFLPGVAAYGCAIGYGIVAFRIEGMAASDVGFILDAHNIYVRTGNHCIYGNANYADSIRVSLQLYNTRADVDRLVAVLTEITGGSQAS